MGHLVYLFSKEEEVSENVSVNRPCINKEEFLKFLKDHLVGKRFSIEIEKAQFVNRASGTNVSNRLLPNDVIVNNMDIDLDTKYITVNYDNNLSLLINYSEKLCAVLKDNNVEILNGDSDIIFRKVELIETELFKDTDKVALVDKDGQPVNFIVKVSDVKYLLYEPYSWGWCEEDKAYTDIDYSNSNFIGDCYIKWDGCSHWYFYGEGYMPDVVSAEEAASYYHICGINSYMKFFRAMIFAFKVKTMTEKEFNEDEKRELTEYEYLLNGLKIVNFYKEIL